MKKEYLTKVVLGGFAVSLVCMANVAMADVSLDDPLSVKVYANELTVPVTFLDTITAKSKVGLGTAAAPVVEFSCTVPQVTGVIPTAFIGVSPWTSQLTGPERYTYTRTGTAVLDTDIFRWGWDTAAAGTRVQMTVNSGSNVSCSYKLFEMAGATTPLASTTGNIIGWQTGLLVGAGDPSCSTFTGCTTARAVVDVGAGGKKFTGGATIGRIGVVKLQANGAGTPAVNDAAGAPVFFPTMVNVTTPATKLEITGDFSAAKNVWVDTLATCATAPAVANKATINTDKTVATFSNTQIGAGWGAPLPTPTAVDGNYICMEVDGTTVINNFDAKGKAILSNGTNYNIPASIELGTVGQVVDNGSTDELQLVLTPGGSYPGYIRINHTSSAAGDITLTLFNDNGQSVTIDLGDIAGQASSTLAGNAATSQMTLTDIYAAAQTADPAFSVNSGKLRITVKSTAPGWTVNASSYSTSKDGNSFVLLQE